ncbi:MAG: class I SAM-dependent methyltransferase [Candidatus Paceibacterota bacterium]
MKSKQALIAETLYLCRPNAERILDVGYAQNHNEGLRGEIYGVDIVAEEKPEHYKEVMNVDLNLCKLPFEDNFFDAISMGCVLAHVTNPLGLLIELHRVLKKDGVIVLSSPNPNYYWENVLNIFFHYFKNRVSKSKFLEHFYEFSRYNMRIIADRAGFKVVDEIGVSFHIIKTKLSFQPKRFPGLAYEIIYVLEKDGDPELYTMYEPKGETRKIPMKLS